MSMNILIAAERKRAFKKKNGKRSIEMQTIVFNAWQTPTKATYEIMSSRDFAAAYINWVLSSSNNPDRFDHVENFRLWCAEAETEGFTLKFEII